MKTYSYVRWSHPSQTLGDSEKRQWERAQLFCKNKRLELSEIRFKDSGISAKAGLNRSKGSAFAELLKFVKSGDWILIEDYDRFSREDPITSLSALRSILKDKKITIVFLSEGVEVNQDNFLDDNIILPLFLKGFLGYRENTKKGERVGKSWKTKFDNMKAGKVEAIALPCWLELKDGKYVVIETAAKIIRRMFELCNRGKGSGEIAKIFNVEKVQQITKRIKDKGYNQPFVLNCLTSKKVIGTNDNIEPNVSGVFPAILDDKTFYMAQSKISERKIFRGIKTADDNIFSGLCICSKCGKTLYRFNNKPGYVYLRCAGVKVGLHNGNSIPFNWFESSFLDTLFKEQKFIRSLIEGEEVTNNIDELKGKISVLDKKIETITVNYTESPSSLLAKVLSKCELDRQQLTIELEQELTTVNSFTPYKENMDDLDTFLNECAGKLGQTEYRKELREKVRVVVEKIIVDSDAGNYHIHFRGGDKPITVHLLQGGGWKCNGKTYKRSMDYRTGKDLVAK